MVNVITFGWERKRIWKGHRGKEHERDGRSVCDLCWRKKKKENQLRQIAAPVRCLLGKERMINNGKKRKEKKG